MDNLKIYRCPLCGNIMEVLNDSGQVPVCCGQPMAVLAANTVDAATEKHVPSVTRNGASVDIQVGSVIHPMEDAHYIQFIIVQQGSHVYRTDLKPGQEPKASFQLPSATEAITVYEYCNLHGLWSANA